MDAYTNKDAWKADLTTLAANIILLLKYHQGSVVVDENTNTLKVLDPSDGVTALLTFNTRDINGNLGHESIYELEAQ